MEKRRIWVPWRGTFPKRRLPKRGEGEIIMVIQHIVERAMGVAGRLSREELEA